MADHPNFYENLREASSRLWRTVVTYEDRPYYVMAVTNHKPDNIFRVYLVPVAQDLSFIRETFGAISNEFAGTGQMIDDYMKNNSAKGILRKTINSPAFNRFRPFPLGMINQGGSAYYLERQPKRPSMSQGLTADMILEKRVSSATAILETGDGGRGLNRVNMYSPFFEDCVLANHPSAFECLQQLNDPDITNDAVAFHRHFALVRGPLDLLFLAYKEDIVGVLPDRDFSRIRLGKNFKHTAEVISELKLFRSVEVPN